MPVKYSRKELETLLEKAQQDRKETLRDSERVLRETRIKADHMVRF